jgi:hypothetical protein
MLAMNKIRPAAISPTELFQKFIVVRSAHRAIWHSANDLGFIKPYSKLSSSNQSFSHRDTDSSQSASQQKRQKRGDNYSNKNISTKDSCWSCGVQGHLNGVCSRRSPFDSNRENVPFLQSAIGKRYAAQFRNKPYLTNARLDEPIVAPTPYTGTGKRNYLYNSNKTYLSYQHIKSYVSSLSNSSLTDFLLVTMTPYRKDLNLQEAEVIGQIEYNQEVEMEVQEVEEAVESLHAVPIAGKSIRALLDTRCLVGDCISKSIVDSLNASHLLFNVSTTICSGFNNQC